MNYQKKILVIDYQVPAEGESASTIPEYFGIESPREKNMTQARDFLDSDRTDTCEEFMSLIESGDVTPAEILHYAVIGWSTMVHVLGLKEEITQSLQNGQGWI
jgi:hypothetical protein